MKNFIILLALLFFTTSLAAQVLSTEIFLVDITVKNNKHKYGKPLNITNHEGYDNQAWFTPDSRKVLYVSMPDTTQTDIYEYTIADSSLKRLSETTESEYSPRYSPDGKSITIVKVNSDKAQNLCRFTSGINDDDVIAPGLDSVGYYCWINDSVVAIAFLNNGMELYIYELSNDQFIIADKGIGRCIMKDPLTGNVLFVKKSGDKTNLYLYDLVSGEVSFYCEGLKNVEDYTIASDGKIFAGNDGKLYSFNLKEESKWKEEADFSKHTGDFYRLAISPDGKKLALVSYAGKRP